MGKNGEATRTHNIQVHKGKVSVDSNYTLFQNVYTSGSLVTELYNGGYVLSIRIKSGIQKFWRRSGCLTLKKVTEFHLDNLCNKLCSQPLGVQPLGVQPLQSLHLYFGQQ